MIEGMQSRKTSEDFLAANLARLEEHVPDPVKLVVKHGVQRPTYYTIRGKKKSPTLRTLDKLAKAFGTPAWLMIHPDMKEWDTNRAWIEHIITAYLAADTDGRELIRRTIIQVEKTSATAVA